MFGCCCCKALAAMCAFICLKSVKQHIFALKRFRDIWLRLQYLPETFKWSHFWQSRLTNIFEMNVGILGAENLNNVSCWAKCKWFFLISSRRSEDSSTNRMPETNPLGVVSIIIFTKSKKYQHINRHTCMENGNGKWLSNNKMHCCVNKFVFAFRAAAFQES